MSRGMSREEAMGRAHRDGRSGDVKEQVREVSWESLVETHWQDLKFGLRLLRFNPAFAATAILSLALGIGANTAIFQLLDAVRLRTLPVKNSGQMVKIIIDHRNGASGNFSTRYSDDSQVSVGPDTSEELKRGAAMPFPALGGNLAGSHAAQRFCARNRELHLPKVRFGRVELHSDILLAVASPVDGDNAAFHRLRGVIIQQHHRLSHQYELFKLKQSPVPVHRPRMGLCGELLASVCLSADGQRHR